MTSFSPRGDASTILRKAEATFSTAPSGNWPPVTIYSHSLEEKQPFVEDPLLGQARNNNRDPLAPAPGLPVLQGDVIAPLDLAQLGYWLTDVFGAPSTSGTTPDYTHVWTSGLEVLPSVAFETKLNTSLFLQHLGLQASKFGFNIGSQGGYDTATVSYIGAIENKITSTAGGTPAAIAARSPLPKAIGLVKVNGTAAGSLMNFKADYENGLKPQLFAGSARPVGFDLDGIPSLKGSLGFRFRDATFYDLAKPISPAVVPATVSLEALWTISSVRSLSILMPACRIEPAGVPIKGPDGLEWSANIRAEQSSSAPMVTVTLRSPTASF
jgi:hypothetical protein